MLTTLDALKAELGVSGTDDDAVLTRHIAAATSAIEAHCARRFGRRAVTDVFRLERSRPLLLLTVTPAVAITSVTEAGEALAAGAYELESEAGRLLRLDGADRPNCWACGKIVVVYDAGYILPGTAGANLPPAIEQACIALATTYWHGRDRDPLIRSEQVEGVGETEYWVGGVPGGLPADVGALLAPHRAVVFA